MEIIIASVIAFIVGAVWYSPLGFGKRWMKIKGVENMSKEEMQKMQKKMTPFYALQFVMTLVTLSILAMNIKYFGADKAFSFAFFMWLGYIVPTQVSAVIWGNTNRKYWLSEIAIMAGCQLVVFMIAAYIFGA